MFENIGKFLEAQKSRMLQLDESEGDRAREASGQDFQLTEKRSGRKIGMREILYNNTIEWIRENSMHPKAELFQEAQLLNQPGVLSEDSLSTAIDTLTTSLLPAIRKIYKQLYAMDLVSVQPLTGPTGYMWFIQKLYSDTYGAESITGGTSRLDNTRAVRYSKSGEKGTIRAIQFKLQKQLVETEIRKLKAEWTIEMEQDLRSQWKLDAEAELTPELIDEISREIDREVIDTLVAGVGHTINWNMSGYLTDDKSSWERRQYRRGVYDSIVDATAWIRQNKRARGVDWWLVMNPATYSFLKKLEEFSANPAPGMETAAIYHRYEGVLANQYKIYVDDEFGDNRILVGIKGGWKYATGYYAPYIPLFTSSKYMINDDFTQFARGAMTRDKVGIVPEVKDGTTNNGLVLINLTSS